MPAQKPKLMAGVSLSILESQAYSGISFQFSDGETKQWVYENIMGVLVPCIQELIAAISQQQMYDRCGALTSTQRRNQSISSSSNNNNPIDWLASLLMRKNPRYCPSSALHPYNLLLQKQLRQHRALLSPPGSPFSASIGKMPPTAESQASGRGTAGAAVSVAATTPQQKQQEEREERVRKRKSEKEAAAAAVARRHSVDNKGTTHASDGTGRRQSQILALHRGDTPVMTAGDQDAPTATASSPASESDRYASWKEFLQEKYELEKQNGIPAFLQWLETEVRLLNTTYASSPEVFEDSFSQLCGEVVSRLASTFDGVAAAIAYYNRDEGVLAFRHVSENSSATLRSGTATLAQAEFPAAPSFQALQECSSLVIQGVAASRDVVFLGDHAAPPHVVDEQGGSVMVTYERAVGDGDMFVGTILGSLDEPKAVLIVDTLTSNKRLHPPSAEEAALLSGLGSEEVPTSASSNEPYRVLDEDIQAFLQSTVSLLSSCGAVSAVTGGST